MKRKTQVKTMMYAYIVCAIFTFTVSLLFGMEVATGLPRYSMESSILAMFAFMFATSLAMVAISDCSKQISKL